MEVQEGIAALKINEKKSKIMSKKEEIKFVP